MPCLWLLTFSILAVAQTDTSKPPTYPDHSKLLVVRSVDGKETPIATKAEWQTRREHILANLQAVMGPLPGNEKRVPLKVEYGEAVETATTIRKKVTFVSEPGDRVPAWLMIPKGLKGKAPAMLCLHQTTGIGKNEPTGLGGKPNLWYAKELAERGYVTLTPDYCGGSVNRVFGEYKINPYAFGYASATMKGIWNHIRAVDLLVSLPEVDPDKIGVIGHSLGGHNSIFVALFDERIKAVVSSCGFNAYPYYYKGNITGWSHEGYMPRLKSVYNLDLKQVPFDFPELIAALAPRAFFTCSPTHDSNFEVEGVKVCITAAMPIYELFGASDKLQAAYPDAEHDFPKSTREEAYKFLDKNLGK
jgi:dienelactone hydrolase